MKKQEPKQVVRGIPDGLWELIDECVVTIQSRAVCEALQFLKGKKGEVRYKLPKKIRDEIYLANRLSAMAGRLRAPQLYEFWDECAEKNQKIFEMPAKVKAKRKK